MLKYLALFVALAALSSALPTVRDFNLDDIEVHEKAHAGVSWTWSKDEPAPDLKFSRPNPSPQETATAEPAQECMVKLYKDEGFNGELLASYKVSSVGGERIPKFGIFAKEIEDEVSSVELSSGCERVVLIDEEDAQEPWADQDKQFVTGNGADLIYDIDNDLGYILVYSKSASTTPPPTSKWIDAGASSPPTAPTTRGPTYAPTEPFESEVADMIFDTKKEALPNVKGWTEFEGRTGRIDWKIGNIVPRSMNANVGFHASSENGVPTIRLVVSDKDTKLSNGAPAKSDVESAKLCDIALDYFIKGNGLISGVFIDYKGTIDIVLQMKVDATIKWDASTRKWKMDGDQITFAPAGKIDFGVDSIIFSWFVQTPIDIVLSDFVTSKIPSVVSAWIPEQMSFGLPEHVRDMIENHFGTNAGTTLSINGEASWFLPVDGKYGDFSTQQSLRKEQREGASSESSTALVQQHEQWSWFHGGPTSNPTPSPTFDTMFTPNPLALPVFYKDLDGQGSNDYEVTNVVPHVANFQLVSSLVESNGRPQISVTFGASCHQHDVSCGNKPARIELDVDYYFKHHMTGFNDKGTVKIELDTAFKASLDMKHDGTWELSQNEEVELHVDGEMKLEDSRWSAIVNPALKLFFNDQLEGLLAGYIKTHFMPTIPSYLPQHYTMLLEDIIRASSKNNMKVATNVNLNIPRKSTTLYLQDRLQQQLEAQEALE